jgi:hypothetical protein
LSKEKIHRVLEASQGAVRIMKEEVKGEHLSKALIDHVSTGLIMVPV